MKINSKSFLKLLIKIKIVFDYFYIQDALNWNEFKNSTFNEKAAKGNYYTNIVF